MKTLRFTMLFLIVAAFFSASGDITLTQKRTNIFVSLQNPGDFPEYKFIGLDQLKVGVARPYPFPVEKGKYYPTYSVETVDFVALKKSYAEGKALDDIDWQKDKNIIKPNISIHPYNLVYSNKIENIRVDYRIVGFSNNSMVVYRASEIFQFRDKNRADSICHFEYKGELTGLTKTTK